MDKSKFHLLLVDDEPDIIEFVSYNLSREGYQISTAKNGLEAVEQVKKNKPDLILMDIMMPVMDGMTAVSKIKALPGTNDIMIVFLTARAEDYSQEAGFEAGADDYISKPIKPKILVHRINALLRRINKTDNNKTIECGSLIIDPTKYVIIYQSNEVVLPRKEFELLQLLASHPNKVFNRDEILAKVWGKDVVVGDRTIDVHIRKIREKINANIIITIKGVGYKFVE
ncbi:MAG: DNA-binding response regulator [Bacteroidetes bacterium]|nr:MAG: DNA-binding response regulator [Bacteroidota bacterium]